MRRTHLAMLAAFAALALCAVGCANRGLIQVMKDNDFTAFTPPQSGWELGSVITVEPNEPNSPVLRVNPSSAGVTPAVLNSTVPTVSRTHEDKFDLSVGLTLPQSIGAQLKVQGGSQYSVVADGNSIRRIALDPYIESFKVIRDKYGKNWIRDLADHKLFYIFELWFAEKLEYKFYNSAGISLKLTVPIKIPVDLSPSWTVNDSGTVSFSDKDHPICLGYRARPIRVDEGGVITPQSLGKITAAGREARKNPDK